MGVPVDPLEGGPFDRFERTPGPETADHLGLEQPDDGLGEGVDAPMSVKRMWASARGQHGRASPAHADHRRDSLLTPECS
jgi:hypothetical protein